MTQTQPQHKDFFERWNWVWTAVFYLSLFIPTALIVDEVTGNERVWLIALVLFSCGWHGLWVVWILRRFGSGQTIWMRQRPYLGLLYLVVVVLVWTQLLAIHEVFYIHLSGLFSQFYVILPIGWAITGTTVLTSVVVLRGAFLRGEAISWQDPSVWGLVFGIAGANLFGLWIHGIIRESHRRRELLEKLHQTQAELAVSERNAGALAERQRLSHEIHDTLAQGFIGIIMHLEAAQTVSGEQALNHVQKAEQMARQNLKQARYLVEDLRPEPLQKASLPVAITQIVGQWREQSKVVAHVTITGEERPLPPNTEHTLLRAAQEALANVHKHAQAQEVTVTLSYMGDCVMLDVQDDGVGLNGADSQWQGGFGLTAMRERVEQLGGSLLVESEDDEGVTVVVSIPISD
ncbi:MAG: sensor histidine kinase [Ardenticatenaceae bacterium]|nr:sensor histidine kinase [Ardenticatenaceae bacterium]